MKNAVVGLPLKPPYRPRSFVFKTEHGDVHGAQFMPVGTQATVKGLTPRDLHAARAEMILGNTYHLYLRPGHKRIERLGGLHEFMKWNGPILTDSGGFQVFSLSALTKVKEEGVEFSSHLDGSKHFFTPELSMEIQAALGSDVVMAFDECPPYTEDKKLISESMERTLRWAKRCRDYKLKPHQKLFGIVQGGMFLDLREECLERLKAIGFDGYALGGLAIGEPITLTHQLVRDFAHRLPEDKPRYLMGVGRPEDLIYCASYGIDLFDCVMPSRNARNGQLFTSQGRVNIKNQQYAEDISPLDQNCDCYTCQNFTKAYLRHLFVAGEVLSAVLNTIHNIHYYLTLMRRFREITQSAFNSGLSESDSQIRFDELVAPLYNVEITPV
jgi:queuine tRNA-ribosyltransferase